MSETFFKVFKKPEDHNNWTKQIQYALQEPKHNDVRDKWVEALVFLSDELGKGFLKSCKRNHPIEWKISNKAYGQIQDLIAFTETLSTLKASHCNYHLLKEKLLSYEDCERQAIPFIDIARDYLKSGLLVKFIEEGNTRKPDIEIINPTNNDKIFIEVSKLEDSDDRRQAWWNYSMLSHALQLQAPFVHFYCRQLDFISETEIQSTLNTILEVKTNAFEKELFLIHEDAKIILAVASTSKREDFENWCKIHKNGNQDFVGMPLNFDDSGRITNKIILKSKQIPQDQNGLIYIPINALCFWQIDFNQAIPLIETRMAGLQNTLGVVLYSFLGQDIADENNFLEGGHFHGKKMINEITSRELVFIHNKTCRLKIQQDTLDRMYLSLL